jgi:hypothetical protein
MTKPPAGTSRVQTTEEVDDLDSFARSLAHSFLSVDARSRREKSRKLKAHRRAAERYCHDPRLRCKCGRAETWYARPRVERVCPWRQCVQIFCPGCGRICIAWGPVGCPCDRGRYGHGRYAEQPKPHVPVKR